MADGAGGAGKVANVAFEGLKSGGKAVGDELQQFGKTAVAQTTNTSQLQNPAQDQKIQELTQKDDEYKQKKLVELEQEKKELIQEHHKEVQEWDDEMLARQKQEEEQKAQEEAILAEKKKQEEQAKLQEQPVVLPGEKDKKPGTPLAITLSIDKDLKAQHKG